MVNGGIEAIQSTGVVAGHGVVVHVDGHWAVGVELARRLAMERLLKTLRAGRARRGIVVVHVVGVLVTHGGWTGGIRATKIEEECGYGYSK